MTKAKEEYEKFMNRGFLAKHAIPYPYFYEMNNEYTWIELSNSDLITGFGKGYRNALNEGIFVFVNENVYTLLRTNFSNNNVVLRILPINQGIITDKLTHIGFRNKSNAVMFKLKK